MLNKTKPIDVLDRELVRIPIGQPHAYGALSEVSNMIVRAVPFSYIEEGLFAREWAYIIVERYDYIKKKLTDKHYTVDDRLTFVFDPSRNVTSSLDDVVKKYFRTFLKDGFIAPVLEEENEIAEIRRPYVEYIKTNHKYFGYLTRYYLMKNPDVIARGQMSKVWVYQPTIGRAKESLTFEKMINLAKDYKLNDWISERFNANIVIEFLMYAKYEMVEVNREHHFTLQDLTFKLQDTSGGMALPYTGSLKCYYQVKDRVIDVDKDNTIRIPTVPHLVPNLEDLPFRFDIESFSDLYEMPSDMLIPTDRLELTRYSDFVKKMLVPLHD